jgi:pimeloyl-ACP methyl ester carboxylesterase
MSAGTCASDRPGGSGSRRKLTRSRFVHTMGRMASVTRAYVPGFYGLVHYRLATPATPATLPPLLCLHQTPSSSAEWEPVLADLAAGRVVVAPDTPGYGMSDPPPAPVSIGDFARTMLRFMDDLASAGVVQAGVFDVMGAHTGSIIATELAGSAPARVRRLVLFGLAAYDAAVRKAKLDTLYEKFPPPGEDLAHVEKLWAILKTLLDPRMTAEQRHVKMAESLRLGSRMPWAYEAVYRYDFLQAMTEVTQPVLVINPEDDLWEPTRLTSGRYRNGRRLDIPGVRHGVLSIEHDRIVAAIRGFLDVDAR